MLFDQIIGQEHIKNHLQTSAKNGRIPHAQLFVGKEGAGTLPMAIAYAQFLLSLSSNDPEASELKSAKLQHPDLHFAFPVTTTDRVKKHPVSDLFMQQWREFIEHQPYGSLFNWLQFIGVENKQGMIGVDEALDIVKKLQLKSYEGGFKVMIIWMAEKMNNAASNKLLKLIEEPPEKTIFLLITENEEQLINTIKSRCQALHLSNEDSKDILFEKWVITWVRSAFKAKGNAAVIQELVAWSDTIAATGREHQKQFLEYCLQFFRQALLLNYQAPELLFLEIQSSEFEFKNFAPFVHSKNIMALEKELNEAIYHIERNGNAKIILLDLSMKLTRLLHKKEAPL